MAKNVQWTSTGTVEYAGRHYIWRSGLVETDYGPERVVEIIDHLGDEYGPRVWTYQECASVATILGWWKQEREELRAQEDAWAAQADLARSGCGMGGDYSEYLEYMEGEEHPQQVEYNEVQDALDQAYWVAGGGELTQPE